MVPFPPAAGSPREFFSNNYCENLVKFLEVSLTILCCPFWIFNLSALSPPQFVNPGSGFCSEVSALVPTMPWYLSAAPVLGVAV